MLSFGENLKRIRQERNMSQDEFAALLGTSKQVISRYENGQRSPKVSVVGHYAEVLGVPIGQLADGGADGLEDDYDLWSLREEFRRNPELRTLFSLSKNASPQELRQMEAFIRAIRATGEYDGDDPA